MRRVYPSLTNHCALYVAQETLCIYGDRMTTDLHPAAPPTPLHRQREYLLWFGGDVAAGIGAGVGQFAYPLIAFAVTGSPSAAGLIGMCGGLALLLGMLPGGVIADRFDRRRLRMLNAALGVGIQLVLVVVLLAGAASLGVLAALTVVDRLRGSLLGSVSDAMLKRLAHPSQFPAAMAANQGRDAAIELGAAPAGGALLGLHLALPGTVQGVGHLLSLLCTWGMCGDYRPRGADAERSHPIADLVDGGRWMLRQQARVQIGVAAALVNAGSNGAFLALTLALAADGVSALRIGLLSTAFAITLIIGSMIAPRVIRSAPTGTMAILSLVLIAALTVAMPLTSNLWVIGVLWAGCGLCVAPLNAAIMGFFLQITPNEMQGRAGAMSGLLAMGLLPPATAFAGFGLDHLGRVPTLAIFGAVCVLGAIVLAAGRQARRIPASPAWADYARAEGLMVADA